MKNKDLYCYVCSEAVFCKELCKKHYYKKYFKEYNQRPEVKEKARKYYLKSRKKYFKDYNQRPEVKEKNRKKAREYYLKNRKKYFKEYNQRPEVKEKARKYYLKNKEKIKEYRTKYYNRPEVKKRTVEYSKKYYQENKEKIEEYSKKYFRRQEVKERIAKKIVERCKVDINFKLARVLRSRICNAIKYCNGTKSLKTEKLLGCTIQQFKKHLESKFKPGMSWDNWTKDGWHIDHIEPCASFDLNNYLQQKKCFHYTNHQPLSAEENWSKGNKMINETVIKA